MAITSSTKVTISAFIIWLFHVSAIIGIHLGHGDWFLPLTPLNLGICFLLILWNIDNLNGKDLLILGIPFVLGMFVELLGVNYGLIFGQYTYGENLGWKVAGVPWMIGINWVILTYATAAIAQRAVSNTWIRVLVATFLMLGLDILLEEMAPVFDFWEFEGGNAPFQNYVGWFFTAFVAQYLFQRWFNKECFPLAVHIFVVFVIFFGVFALFPFSA